MNRKNLLTAAAFALMAVVGLAHESSAGTISVTGSTGAGHVAGVDGFAGVLSNGGFNIDVFAGTVYAKITDPAGTPYTLNQEFQTYCVDLGAGVTVPGTYALTTDSMSNWNLGGSAPVDGEQAAYLYNTYAGVVSTADQRAGLQLAIWEVLRDTTFNLTSGNLSVVSGFSAGAIAYANTIGASVGQAKAVWLKLGAGTNRTDAQDFIGPTPVPEPASLLLLGSGLAAAAWGARRKKNAARS